MLKSILNVNKGHYYIIKAIKGCRVVYSASGNEYAHESIVIMPLRGWLQKLLHVYIKTIIRGG